MLFANADVRFLPTTTLGSARYTNAAFPDDRSNVPPLSIIHSCFVNPVLFLLLLNLLLYISVDGMKEREREK